MKRNNLIYKSIFLSWLLLSVFSCADLDENPTNFVSATSFYENEEQAEFGLNGVYDILQDYTLGYNSHPRGVRTLYGDFGTDRVHSPNWTPFTPPFFLYTLNPLDENVENNWRHHYKGVNRVNNFLDNVKNVKFDSEIKKNQFIGEAKFLRALFYFTLVQVWGEVPLILNETASLNDNNKVERASVESIYNQIIKDLTDAELVLPNKLSDGRATLGAAKALLAKVYMQMAGYPLKQADKYQLAAAKCKEVIDLGIYELAPSLPDLFNDYEDVATFQKEVIFATVYVSGNIGEGGPLGQFPGPFGNGGINGIQLAVGGGIWALRTFNDYYLVDDDSLFDTRLDQNISRFTLNVSGNVPFWTDYRGWFVRKWHKKPAAEREYSDGDTPFDYPILRYADILMLYGEAMTMINGAPKTEYNNYINMVRRRAYQLDPDSPSVVDKDPASMEDFMDFLMHERGNELMMEGHRKSDLVRWEVLEESVQANGQLTFWNFTNVQVPKTKWIWPIPQRELEINPNLLPQNPGYE